MGERVMGKDMGADDRNIIVMLRGCRDPKVPVEPSVSGYGVSERGIRYIMNPADRSALEFALAAAKEIGREVVALCYQSPSAQDMLREALALGAGRAVLLKTTAVGDGDTMVEAGILARFVQLLGCRLFCTGTSMLDSGTAMAPAVAASLLGRCCVHSVVCANFAADHLLVTQKSDRGGRQQVELPLPGFLLFEEKEQNMYSGIEEILNSKDMGIEVWTLVDLGLSLAPGSTFSDYTCAAGTSMGRPRPVAATTPDPALPAFERILSLLQGGIQTRAGKLRFLTAQETAQGLLSVVNAARNPGEAG